MKKNLLFRILGALASALIIVSVFVPYESVDGSSFSLWGSYESLNAIYLPIMIIVFGIIGVVFFALNIKTEFAYMSVGAIVFFLVMQTVDFISRESFNTLSLGYYFLVVGTLLTAIMAFFTNLKYKVITQNSDVTLENQQSSMISQINNLYDVNQFGDTQINSIQPTEMQEIVSNPILNSMEIPANPMSMEQPITPIEIPVNPMPMDQPVQPMEMPVNPIPMDQPVQPMEMPVNSMPMDQSVQPMEMPVNSMPMDQPVQPMEIPVNPMPMDQPVQPMKMPVNPMPMEQPINPEIRISNLNPVVQEFVFQEPSVEPIVSTQSSVQTNNILQQDNQMFVNNSNSNISNQELLNNQQNQSSGLDIFGQ